MKYNPMGLCGFCNTKDIFYNMNINLKQKALQEIIDCKTQDEAEDIFDALEETIAQDEKRKILTLLNTTDLITIK